MKIHFTTQYIKTLSSRPKYPQDTSCGRGGYNAVSPSYTFYIQLLIVWSRFFIQSNLTGLESKQVIITS